LGEVVLPGTKLENADAVESLGKTRHAGVFSERKERGKKRGRKGGRKEGEEGGIS